MFWTGHLSLRVQVLFKKFADLDAFDIELKQPDPEKLVDTIEALEPTFGGINLEDIKVTTETTLD